MIIRPQLAAAPLLIIGLFLFATVTARAQTDIDICGGAAHASLDQAITSCTQLIQSGTLSQSNLASAYNNRGNAYHAKGQDDLAIADYTQALRIDPNYAYAYFGRGYALVGLGRFSDAGNDLARAVSLNRTVAYPVLWLHIARARAGDDDATEFATNAVSLDLVKWPGPVVNFYLGNTTAAQTSAAATDNDQRCEAQFYIAEWQ